MKWKGSGEEDELRVGGGVTCCCCILEKVLVKAIPSLIVGFIVFLQVGSLIFPWYTPQAYSHSPSCKFTLMMNWTHFIFLSPSYACNVNDLASSSVSTNLEESRKVTTVITSQGCSSTVEDIVECLGKSHLNGASWRDLVCLEPASPLCRDLPQLFDNTLSLTICSTIISGIVLLYIYIAQWLPVCPRNLRNDKRPVLLMTPLSFLLNLLAVIIFGALLPKIFIEDAAYRGDTCNSNYAGCTFIGAHHQYVTRNILQTKSDPSSSSPLNGTVSTQSQTSLAISSWGPTSGWILAVVACAFQVLFIVVFYKV